MAGGKKINQLKSSLTTELRRAATANASDQFVQLFVLNLISCVLFYDELEKEMLAEWNSYLAARKTKRLCVN